VIWEGALAARFNGVPHIWHLHEKLAEHPSLKPLFPLSFTYCLMDLLSELVVTASESVKQQLEGFIPDSKIRVILNGVEPPPYLAQDGPSLREELSLPVNTTVVVTIGSIIPEKGYDDLLKAARRVREVNGNVAFLIVGGGAPAEIESLKNAINLLGLSQTVFYLGYRTDVRRVLADSDILVLPSLSEAFSLVTVEAMAAGKPVIATDCGGPSEIIIDGETGFIVPVHDPLALSTKILQLAESKDTISEMSKKGQERYEQNFRAEFFAGNFARLFLELGTNAKVVPLTKAERIVIEGFMEIYQRLAEQRLSRQLVQKLKKGSKVFTNMPLNTLARIRSWCLRSNKRNKC
jgi:glycosyltransferase involved in cell wall biosynthesis